MSFIDQADVRLESSLENHWQSLIHSVLEAADRSASESCENSYAAVLSSVHCVSVSNCLLSCRIPQSSPKSILSTQGTWFPEVPNGSQIQYLSYIDAKAFSEHLMLSQTYEAIQWSKYYEYGNQLWRKEVWWDFRRSWGLLFCLCIEQVGSAFSHLFTFLTLSEKLKSRSSS